VYEEEVTSISRKGESRTVVVEGVLAMVRRLRRTDCQRLLSGESQASSGHWLFRL
jgi:hypothetical protein